MKVSAVERGKYLVTGAKWSEKTCNNQNALLLHTWLINTLMGSSQITRINVGKVQTQMLTLYVHYCLSSALVSFRHKNHLVRKTSWFSLKRLFDLQKLSCELFAVYFEISSGFYIYTSLSWATGAAALLPISESVTWPKTRRLPVNMLSWRPGWMFRQLAWFLLVIQEI